MTAESVRDQQASSRVRRIGAKLSASIGDQALLSISNLATSLVIASQISLNQFGVFGLAFAFYLVCQGCVRSFVGEALLIRNDAATTGLTASEKRSVVGAALALGFIASVAGLVVAKISTGDIRAVFFLLAIVLPGILVQDATRYINFANDQPSRALQADLVWISIQFPIFCFLVLQDAASLSMLMLFWGVAGNASMVFQLGRLKAYPSLPGAVKWINKHRDLSPRYLGEYLTLAGVQQGTVFLVGAIAGLAEVGGLRAAQVLLGPLNILTMGVSVLVLPAAARLAKNNPLKLRGMARNVSLILSAVTLCASSIVFLIPSSAGKLILGDAWSSGRSLVPLLALVLIANNLSYGATSSIRGMEKAAESFKLRITMAPVTVALVAIGAGLGAADGALAALALGGLFQTMLWWRLFLTLLPGYVDQHSKHRAVAIREASDDAT